MFLGSENRLTQLQSTFTPETIGSSLEQKQPLNLAVSYKNALHMDQWRSNAMTIPKPFLAKFSRPPRKSVTDKPHPSPGNQVSPNPRPTIITEVQNETTDDN